MTAINIKELWEHLFTHFTLHLDEKINATQNSYAMITFSNLLNDTGYLYFYKFASVTYLLIQYGELPEFERNIYRFVRNLNNESSIAHRLCHSRLNC